MVIWISSPSLEDYSIRQVKLRAWIIKDLCKHIGIGRIRLFNIHGGNFRTAIHEYDLNTRILSLVNYNVNGEVLCGKGHFTIDRLQVLCNELSAVLAFVVDADKLSVL